MATAELILPEPGSLAARFPTSDATIAEVGKKYMALTIRDIDDKEGFDAVHAARMNWKGTRVAIEKARVGMKSEALEFGRRVDGEAKRLTGLMLPVETHLETEEKTYTDAKEAIKNAARLKAEAEAKALRDAEDARIRAEQEAEAKRLQAERERLDAQRREQEAKAKAEQEKIDAQRRELEAERNRLADIEAERQRAIEMEEARKEAAYKAQVETEQRIAREELEAQEKSDRKEAARKRAEELRPDKEKLLAVAVAVRAIPLPAVSPAAGKYVNMIDEAMDDAEAAIRAIVAEMG